MTSQIEALREGANRDADAHQRKMTALRQQVEASAEQIRGSAARLLDQVQSGAVSIREHAERLLKQSQSGASALGDQAEKLLSHAQESAERFNEQAEAILRRSEATAESMKADLTKLRSEVLEDVDRVQEQVLAAKREIGESRQESSDTVRQATHLHRTAQADSQALLKRADDVQEQTVQLMHMPREVVGEARKNALLLKEMSSKIALVIRQLSDASGKAQVSKHEMSEATASADARLADLRKHSEQVGKLVGVIRQLYGAMDQRIDRLRTRLTSADEMARSVPRRNCVAEGGVELGGIARRLDGPDFAAGVSHGECTHAAQGTRHRESSSLGCEADSSTKDPRRGQHTGRFARRGRAEEQEAQRVAAEDARRRSRGRGEQVSRTNGSHPAATADDSIANRRKPDKRATVVGGIGAGARC